MIGSCRRKRPPKDTNELAKHILDVTAATDRSPQAFFEGGHVNIALLKNEALR
jgi:hypothetical protein